MSLELNIKLTKKLYLEGNSLASIAQQMECGTNTIKRRLTASGVELRANNQLDKDRNGWWQNKEYLRKKYIKEELSTTEVGKLLNAGG